MKQNNRNIYEKLLADNRFALWASGRNESDNRYWEQWKKENSKAIEQFDEAYATVQLFKFKTANVASDEIVQRWKVSKKQMKLRLTPIRNTETVLMLRKLAGVVIFPIILLTSWLFYQQLNLKSQLSQIQEYGQKNSIHVEAPMGGRIEIELPDGSKAWLNSGSEINYPTVFYGDKREVSILGEVYFQVAKSNNSFIVNSPGPTIKVYGTEFNVHAYPDDPDVVIALAEGKIALEKEGREVEIFPGEVAIFNKKNTKLFKIKSDIYIHTCWRDDKYIFRDAPLSTIVKTLERRYNVNIQLEDLDLSKSKYNATFNGQPLEQILELLAFTAPINYEHTKQQLQPDGSYSKAKVKLWKK